MLRFLTQKLRHQTLNEICPLPPTNEPSPSPKASDSLACAYNNAHEDDDDDADDVKTGSVVLETSWSAAALSAAATAADCASQEQHRRLIVAELDDVEAEPFNHQPSFVTPLCIADTMLATDHGCDLERRTSVAQLPAADIAAQASRISDDVGSKSRAKRKRPKLGRGAAVGSDGCCGSTVAAAATDSEAAAAKASVASAFAAMAMASSGNAGSRYCSSDSSSDEEVVELLSGRRAAARPAVAYGDATAAAAGATPTVATNSATCIADDDACCCCCRKSTSELVADQVAELGRQAELVVSSKAVVAAAAGGDRDCCCGSSSGFGRAQSDMQPCSSLASGLCATEVAAAAASASSGGASLLTHGVSIAVSPRKRPHCAAAAPGHAVDGGLRLLPPVLRQQRQQQQQLLQPQPVDEDDSRSRRNVVVANNAGTVLVSRPSLDLEKMHQKAAAFKRHYPRTIRIRCWNGGSNAGSCPMPEPLRPPSDFLFRSLDTVLVPGSHLTPVERPSACSV